MFSLFFVTLAVILSLVSAAIDADLVTSLPGWDGALPSKHYSGLLPVGSLSGLNGHLHYWYIESTNDPANDPVVLWLNGGPGSSSLIGLLTENGQLVLNDDSLANESNGIPKLYLNEYSWTTKANVLWLESPKGVGFSYCDNNLSSAQCINNDSTTAQDAYEFLVNFFKGFPELRSHKFFITGESYAGIYIPMLIEQIDLNPLGANAINLQGAAIGNGCWGNTVGTCYFNSGDADYISTEFYHGHGMISNALYSDIQAACGDFSSLTTSCTQAVQRMNRQIGTFNIYNIYDECGNDQRRRLSDEELDNMYEIMRAGLARNESLIETKDSYKIHPSVDLNDYECGAETAMDNWLSHPLVAQALHVSLGTNGQTYKKTATNLLPLYSSLIAKHRILIYSGDTDGCVPYVGTENWTRNLGFSVVNEWHQWFSRPDMIHGEHKAGYAVEFSNNFQFITINGAGHMVPQYQPAYALTMFEKFLAGSTF